MICPARSAASRRLLDSSLRLVDSFVGSFGPTHLQTHTR